MRPACPTHLFLICTQHLKNPATKQKVTFCYVPAVT